MHKPRLRVWKRSGVLATRAFVPKMSCGIDAHSRIFAVSALPRDSYVSLCVLQTVAFIFDLCLPLSDAQLTAGLPAGVASCPRTTSIRKSVENDDETG